MKIDDTPTKAELEILERLFKQEIDFALSKKPQIAKKVPAKLAASMEEEELIEPYMFDFGRDAFGKIEVPGHVLTDRGRYLFCLHCAEEAEAEEGEAQR